MAANIPKVLVVDDAQIVADTLAVILSTSGYEARTAYSAEQCIEVIAEWPPDLATIDVVLPGMNGVDLAILLTRKCPACRILLFSGQWITTELLAEAATKGYEFDLLAKPAHPAVILETVSKMLTSKQTV